MRVSFSTRSWCWRRTSSRAAAWKRGAPLTPSRSSSETAGSPSSATRLGVGTSSSAASVDNRPSTSASSGGASGTAVGDAAELRSAAAQHAREPVPARVQALLGLTRDLVIYSNAPEVAAQHQAPELQHLHFIERTLQIGAGDCDMQNALLVVLLQEGGGLVVEGIEDFAGIVSQGDGQPAHLGEVASDLFGERGRRVTSASDLGHVQGEGAHPVDIADDLESAHHTPQITRDGRLQREHRERLLLGLRGQLVHPVMVGDDAFGKSQIGLEKCLGGARHRRARELAHVAQNRVQALELLLIGVTHGVQVTWPGDRAGEAAMNVV